MTDEQLELWLEEIEGYRSDDPRPCPAWEPIDVTGPTATALLGPPARGRPVRSDEGYGRWVVEMGER